MRLAGKILTLPLIGLVRLYQVTLSPMMGGQCRYSPTCSVYAIDALHEYGPIRGSWMAFRRILRCHPLARGGYDPVAPKATAPKAPKRINSGDG